MRKVKAFLASLMALTLALTTAACAAGGTAPAASPAPSGSASAAQSTAGAEANTELSGSLNLTTSWGDGTTFGYFEELGKAFMEKYPNVQLTIENLGTNSDEVIKSRDAAGNLPDLFTVYNLGPDALQSWVDSGKIQDISSMPIFQELPEEAKARLSTEDGKAYAMLVDLTGYVLMWNKDLFEQAGITERPDTLSKLTDAVEKLNAAGIQPFAVGAKDGWTISNGLWRPGLDYSYPPEWNQAMYEGDASFKDYGYDLFPLIDLVIANADANLLDVDFTTAETQFATGEAAMIINGPWVVQYITQNLDPEFASKIDAVSIPWGDDLEKNKQFVMQGTGYVVSSDADLDIVNAFFDFMVKDPAAAEQLAKINFVSSYFDIPLATDPASKAIQDAIANDHWIFDFQDNNRSGEWFMRDWVTLQDYAAGKLTQDQVLEDMDAAWAEITAKNA